MRRWNVAEPYAQLLDFGTLHRLGIERYQQGDVAGAVDLIARSIAQYPQPGAFCDLGVMLHTQGRLAEAEDAYRTALRLRPGYPEAHNNLGITLHTLGRLDEAEDAYRAALGLRPDYAEALNNLAITLTDLMRTEEALTACRVALSLLPNYPQAHLTRANALLAVGRTEAALAACETALTLNPHSLEGLVNHGNALRRIGRLDEALARYDQALALHPGYVEARVNRSLLLLGRGDMERGWAEYEWRFRTPRLAAHRLEQPQWMGEPLAGRTILLHAEQGFGDTLQFVRYAPLVAQRGGRVLLGAPAPLHRLLRTLPGVERVLEADKPPPPFDLHCPLMSLPLAFGTRLDTVPAEVPYLAPDPADVAAWRDRLPDDGVLRVGLVWAGNPRPDMPHANLVDRRRSLRLEQLAPLAGVPGVRFYSLQKDGDAALQAKDPPSGMDLVDLMEGVGDFADTAALIANLDLVIGVDTSVIHVAGALGKPVWVLSRFDGCWRWLTERDDSPWYPSMRLFRQETPGEWAPVIEQVMEALRDRAA
ncbi:MAG TPA: tetratricopeptide repeat-containing glycosyltransferase family protein [Azospirillum sp.]